MSTFTSPYQLPCLTELTKTRESKINSLINNLKIDDVRDDKTFEKTTSCIKMEILITPVEMGDPKFLDHEYEERPLSLQQQVLGVASRHHYNHQISFPFTGDSELLSHQPESGFSYSSSDRGLIMPYGNEIIVEVDLSELNPEKAISAARKLLNMTMQFMNSNNASIQTWRTGVEQRIEAQLKKKREELIKLFGDK